MQRIIWNGTCGCGLDDVFSWHVDAVPPNNSKPPELPLVEIHAYTQGLFKPFFQTFRPEFLSMPIIRLKENEPFEVALRRFKRTIEKTGLLTELRAREFYEKPTAERKRKLAAAVKRHYKRLRSQTLPKKMY